MNFAAGPSESISVPYLGTLSLPVTDAELLKSLQPPEVHSWTLSRVKECEEYLRTDEDASVINLPELRELRVHEDCPRLLSRFLHHITFPLTAALYLESGDHMFSDVLPACHRECMLKSATTLDFIIPEFYTGVASTLRVYKRTKPILMIKINVSGKLLPSLAALVDNIASLLPAHISNIRMTCQIRFFHIHAKLLTKFPHVKRLTLALQDIPSEGSVGSLDIINRILTAQRFVCPQLEDLVIKGLIPSAATLATDLRISLQACGQTRLRSLEVCWSWKTVLRPRLAHVYYA